MTLKKILALFVFTMNLYSHLLWRGAGLSCTGGREGEVFAQLKSVIEDFEGFADGQSNFQKEGIFTFGGVKISTEQKLSSGHGYSGTRALKAEWTGKEYFGGWGIGVGLNKELDVKTDYLNFYIYTPLINSNEDFLKIILQDDDDNNAVFDENKDDVFYYALNVEKPTNEWILISVPLKNFKDENKGGDGKFNINRKEGKLITFSVSFLDVKHYTNQHCWYFDFISFSKGELVIATAPHSAVGTAANCFLGVWSKEPDEINYLKMAQNFEAVFSCANSKRKLGMVSFYKPFAADGSKVPNLFPAVEQINALIQSGYTPMITIESRYAKVHDTIQQPNLYAIIEGHMDYYFSDWARRIKNVNGTVLLRVLHEFNGNWYPWCIANNDKNPQLYIKAFRHIRQIFRNEKANNVKFIWCPNSMSTPQEEWNFVLDAYPGNEYVDYIGLDVFNGAGQKGIPIWHSFMVALADDYFLLTENFPDKPLIICETSSRERFSEEKGYFPGKAEWIMQAAEALKTTFPKVKLVVWFHQEEFKANTTVDSWLSYLKNFWMDDYFIGGTPFK